MFQQKQDTNLVVEQDTEPTSSNKQESMSVDRIQTIEDEIEELKKTQATQQTDITKLSLKSTSPTPKKTTNAYEILSVAHAQGNSFSTDSNSYTPTGVFTNITCSQKCILWVNFYTSSKNNTANNVNTYTVLIDGQDKGIFTQATMPISNSAQSVSLNTTQAANIGTHTVEIQAKTSGGTLIQDISYLQVMALAQ
jgi:hypothetical protein